MNFDLIPRGIDSLVELGDANGQMLFWAGKWVHTEVTELYFNDADKSLLIKDKIKLTQADGNEYITGVADNYVDIGATTAIRMNNDLHVLGDATIISFGVPADNDYTIQWDGNDAIHTITAGDFVFTGGNVGIGMADPAFKLEINGKFGIDDKQIIYLPDQTDFQNSLFFGDGGTNLSHTGGSEGHGNIGLGLNVFLGLTTGYNNTGIGNAALRDITSHNSNMALGSASLTLNKGHQNTAIGQSSGYNKQTGDGNVLIGYNAGKGTGLYNTEKNVIIGRGAGSSMATGALNNTLIGYAAGDNITTGHDNLIIGHDLDPPSATDNNKLAIGGVIEGNLANGAIGYGTETKADKRAQQSIASGKFANAGDAQGSNLILRRSVAHSDNAWYELFLNGSSERLTIGNNTVWTFDILLTGTTSGCTKSWGFKIEGVIENDGGTTTILVSNVATLYDTDDVSFDARVTADDPNDALLIEVTDADSGGDTVRWVAKVSTVEVTF